MEPDRQIEIQLGHMCNNRCVFCVSGQRTALGEAGPMPVDPILKKIRQARELGHHKITLLGGEPTLQPGFLRIVQETVDLGFEQIVIFTNGVKTARAEVIDEVVATGGNITWRISIQGATRESHERTTLKRGSFGRIERTLEHLAERGEHITVNMCVVQSNFEDIDRFGPLLLPYGVKQLHLDMMRPLDAGERTEEELRATLPRYSDLAEPMRRMVAGFPDDFDVNVGNLPFCVAPDLAPWIHHDGEHTDTIAIDGDDRLSRPWNKYLVKRRDKLFVPSCASCVMRDRCSGVFETYARFYGTDELEPLSAESLRDADSMGRLLGVWAPAMVAGATARSETEVDVSLGGLVARLDSRAGAGIARYGRFWVRELVGNGDLRAMAQLLAELDAPVHPIGPAAPAKLRGPLGRLRDAAPFGALRWTELDVIDGRAELTLADEATTARFWIGWDEGPRGGYEVDGEATEAIVEGLGEAMRALRTAPAAELTR